LNFKKIYGKIYEYRNNYPLSKKIRLRTIDHKIQFSLDLVINLEANNSIYVTQLKINLAMSKSYSNNLWAKYKDFGIGLEEKCFLIIIFSR
jgi:hypothetical protein